MVPVVGKLLGMAVGWLADLGASKLLPGDYMLVNILIELSKGTIHMDHFESPNFYLKIGERKRGKASGIASFEKHYKTQRTSYHKKYLNTNSDTLNNDYCLEILHDLGK
jgi:hypothetical protein